MAAIIGLLAIYTWATLVFGFRFSNLTYRGVIESGPYRYVRHPAYVAKNVAWWLEYAPGLANLQSILFLLCWNGIYWLRALSEERHLGRFAAYRAYQERVRWRLIPGIF